MFHRNRYAWLALAVVVLVLLLFAVSAARAATLPVTPATLTAQLAKAKPGDTIAASGTFGAVTLKAKSGLTIRGLRAASLTLRGGSGLTFNDTQIAATPLLRHSLLVNVIDGRGVTFNRLSVTALPTSDGVRRGYGIAATGGADIAFSDVFVTGATKGMVLQGITGLTVRRVVLERLQSDGIQVGALDGALFEDIEVGELRPSATDHPDGFQALNASANVTIRDFRFRSTGPGDGQGIFLSDAKGAARYTNIVIEDVLIANRFGRCVSVDKADGVRLRNVVCTPRKPFTDRPGIWMKDVTGFDAVDTVACTQSRVGVTFAVPETGAATLACPR